MCAAKISQHVGRDVVPLALVVIVVNARAGLAAHGLVDELVIDSLDLFLDIAPASQVI